MGFNSVFEWLIYDTVNVIQAVSRRPPTGVARVRSSASPCGICGEKSDTTIGFLQINFVSPVTKIPLMIYAHLHLLLLLPAGQPERILGTSQNAILFRKLNTIGFRNSLVKPWVSIKKFCRTPCMSVGRSHGCYTNGHTNT